MATTEHLEPYSLNNDSFWNSFPCFLDLMNFNTRNLAALDTTESTVTVLVLQYDTGLKTCLKVFSLT